ncbi:MAG: RNA polymerase sigma factor [Myxococcales bacterium]|nr:RNA polymerase sigma factor [Myxococcales bacterium]
MGDALAVMTSGLDPAQDQLRELAHRAASGDREATASLLKTLAPRLVAVVRAVLGASHPDLDDAVQHALIAFVQALPTYRGECGPMGFGRIIALRAAIAVRKRSRAHAARHDAEVEQDTIEVAEPSPGDEAVGARRKALLRDLLAELPAEQAEAIALRVVFGCSLEEVAEETGAPLNTVRSRVRLAKERLRARIDGDPTLSEALEVTA